MFTRQIMFTVNLKYKYSGARVLVLSHCPSQPFLLVHLHFFVTPTYCRNIFYHSHHMGLGLRVGWQQPKRGTPIQSRQEWISMLNTLPSNGQSELRGYLAWSSRPANFWLQRTQAFSSQVLELYISLWDCQLRPQAFCISYLYAGSI